MRRRSRGQSLVELALLFPLLVLILFGIIDLGWYVYGYATIYQSARNAAEKASLFPPYPNKLGYGTANVGKPDWNDTCVQQIMENLGEDATLFPDLATGDYVRITYPNTDASGKPIRELSQPIEIKITYSIEPLTPLFRFVNFGNNGRMTVTTIARRSIESLGNSPQGPNGVVCQS
jgi:hypothetical protein